MDLIAGYESGDDTPVQASIPAVTEPDAISAAAFISNAIAGIIPKPRVIGKTIADTNLSSIVKDGVDLRKFLNKQKLSGDLPRNSSRSHRSRSPRNNSRSHRSRSRSSRNNSRSHRSRSRSPRTSSRSHRSRSPRNNSRSHRSRSRSPRNNSRSHRSRSRSPRNNIQSSDAALPYPIYPLGYYPGYHYQPMDYHPIQQMYQPVQQMLPQPANFHQTVPQSQPLQKPSDTPCKFGLKCTKEKCTFVHPSKWTELMNFRKSVSKSVPALYKTWVHTKKCDGEKCIGEKCTYVHPERGQTPWCVFCYGDHYGTECSQKKSESI